MTLPAILHNPVVIGSLGLSAGTIVSKLRDVPNVIWSWIERLFTCSVQFSNMEDEQTHEIVREWMGTLDYAKRTRNMTVVRSDDKWILTPAPGNHFFFFEGKATWLNRNRQQPSSSPDSKTLKFQDTITIRMATRDKRILHRLLESIDHYQRNAQVPDGCMRVWSCEHSSWFFRGSRQARPLESVILPTGKMDEIISDLQWFWNNSERYYSLGIPYRRGWLLKGVPGSGKTSLVGAIAGHYKRDIYILSLNENSMSDTRLLNLISSVKKGSIVLIEDIDAAFKQREAGKDGVTFSGLLNALDGVASPDNLVLFMTTNHPEKLDPALIRPGRIDRTMDFGAATDDQLARLYKRFTNGQHPEGFVEFFRGKTVAEAQVYLLGKEIAA